MAPRPFTGIMHGREEEPAREIGERGKGGVVSRCISRGSSRPPSGKQEVASAVT
jgi:hypothetical protein